MKTHLVIKQNIDALLHAQGRTRRDLAQYVMQTHDKRADSWISHIFGKKGYYVRVIPAQYLDRIAGFFGVQVYHLFQPGLVARSWERRTGTERRGQADRRKGGRLPNLPTTTIRQVLVTPEDEALLEELHDCDYETYQHVKAWVTVARLRSRQSKTTPPDGPQAGVPGSAPPTTRLTGKKQKKGAQK